jgi:hypothetical protein
MHDGPVTEKGVQPATWPPAAQEAPESEPQEETQAADPGAEAPVQTAKQRADDELFFLRMLKPFTRYQPVVAALRSGEPRVVVGLGEASHHEVAPRSAVALAERLGTPPVTFPGDHGGFMADPVGFADALSKVLAVTL